MLYYHIFFTSLDSGSVCLFVFFKLSTLSVSSGYSMTSVTVIAGERKKRVCDRWRPRKPS